MKNLLMFLGSLSLSGLTVYWARIDVGISWLFYLASGLWFLSAVIWAKLWITE